MKALLFYCLFPVIIVAQRVTQDKSISYTIASSILHHNGIVELPCSWENTGDEFPCDTLHESTRTNFFAAVLQKKTELYEILTHDTDHRGVFVTVEFIRGGGCSGELLSVRDSSLMILVRRYIDQKGVKNEFIDIQVLHLQTLARLAAHRGSKTGEGTIIGIVAGVTLGKIMVSSVLSRSGEDDLKAGKNLSPRVELMTSLLGAVLGAFVVGMIPDEKMEIVHPRGVDTEKLRSLARYREDAPPQLLHMYELLECDSISKEIGISRGTRNEMPNVK